MDIRSKDHDIRGEDVEEKKTTRTRRRDYDYDYTRYLNDRKLYREYFVYIHIRYVEQNPQYSNFAFLTALPLPPVEQHAQHFNILTT